MTAVGGNPTEHGTGLREATRHTVLAVCETCRREFFTATSARKRCDVPTCRGYLRHIDRGRGRGL